MQPQVPALPTLTPAAGGGRLAAAPLQCRLPSVPSHTPRTSWHPMQLLERGGGPPIVGGVGRQAAQRRPGAGGLGQPLFAAECAR